MKKKLYALLLCILVGVSVKAQDFFPGPDVQNLTEGKNVVVDYATGLFHYKVPLYTLKSGDYELPISLDYVGKGVKVSDPYGLVGYNWSLNVGGIVTRTMRGGFADEERGYLINNEYFTTPLEQDAKSVGLRKRDGESDIFTAVFNGKKVDFIIQMDEDFHVYALPLEQTDVHIECEGGYANITGWVITDNNGDRYIYRQEAKHKDVKYVNVSTSNGISTEYTSAWYLTRILPYNGAPIDFYYNGDTYRFSDEDVYVMDVYDSYKMNYTYGSPVKEQPFDFGKYRSEFDFSISKAKFHLSMCSLQMSIEDLNSKLRDFNQYGLSVIQPLNSGYIKTNARIVGLLSDISQMDNFSKQLKEALESMAKYCRNMSGGDRYHADMASSYLDGAAFCIESYLSEVRYIKTKEISGGSSYSVLSPLLDRITSSEYVIKFAYHSSSTLSSVSLHNRNMELLSSYSMGSVSPLKELAFLDKNGRKISITKFDYYDKDDFSGWKEKGKDLWGYPVAQNEEDEVCEEYAMVKSLKSIALSGGGKIGICYERNRARNTIVGGIRLKSLVFGDMEGARNDTIFYAYPQMGVSVYYNFSNKVTITYPMCSDIIVYDCVQPEGHPIINTGNNGFYYPCVAEIVSGKGSTVYHYQVVSPSSTTDNYPYWLNGLLTEKQMYNVDGELLKRVRYIYDVHADRENRLLQIQPSNFYLDGDELRSFYNHQGTAYLTGEEFYECNIKPRLTPTNTDKLYYLQHSWKIALKEEVEYRNNGNTPYYQTKYFYDNEKSMFPTRIVRIGSDGIERIEVVKRVMDMANVADSVFIKMKEARLLSPVIKLQNLIDGKLTNETVYRYQSDGKGKPGSIVLAEELTYTPDTPKVYLSAVIDTLLFIYGDDKYVVEASHRYVRQKEFRLRVETEGRTAAKSYAYDDYGKLLMESDANRIAVSDKYKGANVTVNGAEINSVLKSLRKYRYFFNQEEGVFEEIEDKQFLRFLASAENDLISSFMLEIIKNRPDLSIARNYYEHIEENGYKALSVFVYEYERLMKLYPESSDYLRGFLNEVEALFRFDKLELFNFFYLKFNVANNGFANLPQLTPLSGVQYIKLYILDGNETASGVIAHSGGKTSYTVESLSSSKLKIYTIYLGEYSDITSVTTLGQGSYMALVPEGANFEAISYNEDGTIYARFDQSGNVEYYTYDSVGRVTKVEDQYGNILKIYEHNQSINE